MKKLRVAALLAGGIGVMACLVIACGDDDSGIIIDSDSGTDSGKDASNDAASDAGDAGTDGGEDAGDAGSFTTNDLIQQVADAYCDSLSRCCFGGVLDGGTPVDGGGDFNSGIYDRASCVQLERGIGFEGSSKDLQTLYNADAGGYTIDRATAASCVEKMKAISCTLGRAEFVALRDACFGATKGAVAVGGDCTSSVQCGAGLFCSVTTSKCEALRGSGASCALVPDAGSGGDTARNDEACSTRSSGDTGLFCNMLSNRDDSTTWKCTTQLPNGSQCDNSSACAEGFCSTADSTVVNGNYTCHAPAVYFPRDPSNCGALVTQQ